MGSVALCLTVSSPKPGILALLESVGLCLNLGCGVKLQVLASGSLTPSDIARSCLAVLKSISVFAEALSDM